MSEEVNWHISHWENGQKQSSIPYIKSLIPFFNSKVHGLATWWYINGKKRIEASYVKGQVHGLETWWHSDGSLDEVRKYNKGEQLVRLVFSKEGNVPDDAKLEVDLFTNEAQVL